jgi:transcriptional regulator with XRE-family HTH domain
MTRETINEVIGRNIRAYRNARGIPAVSFGADIAARLGTKPWPRQTVYAVEAGDRAFAIAELMVIANLLEVTLDDLIGDDFFPKHAKPFEGAAILKAKIADAISDLSRLAAQI